MITCHRCLKISYSFAAGNIKNEVVEKTKVPYNPVTGKRAKPNQRGTFKDFNSAVAAISDYCI